MKMIFCRRYLDIVNSGIELHEFGHVCRLEHCPHPYCIMNVDKSPAALMAKIFYGLNYCHECRAKVLDLFKARGIIDENGNQIKKLYGLGIEYNYSGNIKIVNNIVRIKLKQIFNLEVNMENLVITQKDISEEDVGENGEIKDKKIFTLLSDYGIDVAKYAWWRDVSRIEYTYDWLEEHCTVAEEDISSAHNLLFEVNDPIKPHIRWGYCCGYIQYDFGPPIRYLFALPIRYLYYYSQKLEESIF